MYLIIFIFPINNIYFRMALIGKYNSFINKLMHTMNALLVSMSVNMYSQNGSTDWRQRPECSHILSQLQTFITNKPILKILSHSGEI